MMAGPTSTVTGATMTVAGRTTSTAVTPLCTYAIYNSKLLCLSKDILLLLFELFDILTSLFVEE